MKTISALIALVIVFGVGLFFFLRDSGEIKKLFAQSPQEITRTLQKMPTEHWQKLKGEIERFKDKIVSEKVSVEDLVEKRRRMSPEKRDEFRERTSVFEKQFLAVYLAWKVGSVSDEEAVNYYFDHADPEGPLRTKGYIWSLYREALGQTDAFNRRCFRKLNSDKKVHRSIQRDCARHLADLETSRLDALLDGKVPSSPELLEAMIHHFISQCRPIPKEYFQAWLSGEAHSPAYWISQAFPPRAAYGAETLKIFEEKISQAEKKLPPPKRGRMRERWNHFRERAQKNRARSQEPICRIKVG